MRKTNIAYGLFLSLFLLILSAFSPATAESIVEVRQYWLEDTAASMSIDDATAAFNQGRGKPMNNTVFQLGNKPTQVWVLITAHNQGTQQARLRLLAGVPYSRLLKAHLLQPENDSDSSTKPETILLIDEHENHSFKERNNAFRLLNSDTFEVAGGDRKQLLIQTIVEGPSYLPFSLVNPGKFSDLQLRDSVFGALFYGFTATLGLLFLLFSLAVRHRIALLYSGLFLLGLLAMADIDGFAFQWLWPNSPKWNHFSPMVILPLVNGLGFLIIHQLLTSVSDQRFSWLKPLALTLAVISLAIPLLLPVLPFSTLIQIENLLSIPAFLLQPIAFTSWLHLGRRNFFSLLALVAVNLSLAALVLLVFIDIPLPGWLLEHVHHAAYLIVGLMVMSIIAIQLMGLHKDQQSALQRELVLARQNAQINQELLTAEQNYSRAQRLASIHKQQLASASHDLRQPIVSLRSSIDAISMKQSIEVRKQLGDAFDYLEQLCNQHLQQSRPEIDDENTPKPNEKTEAYPASLILNTVHRMFGKEATSRGIELNKVDCSVLLTTEPLILMRIVSNLVANAIKHHPGGEQARVVLGCRRKNKALHILICDNGAGMSKDEVSQLQQPYQKGEDSEGEGLGLAIIQQLAQENGIQLNIHSEPGKGSIFTVEVLLA